MSEEETGDAGAGGPWDEVAVDDVRIGDRVRARGGEFTVARIDHPFLGRDEMVVNEREDAKLLHGKRRLTRRGGVRRCAGSSWPAP